MRHRTTGPILALLLLAGAQDAPTSPTSRPTEVTSELGDLWRENDKFYLRVDGRTPKDAGLASAGTREMIVRVQAMARGRPWPGRWTQVELEVRTARGEPLWVGTPQAGANVTLPPNTQWVPLRLPVGSAPADVVLRSAGGLAAPLEFRRVRLVDDRWVLWTDGWRVAREAGVWKLGTLQVPGAAYDIATVGKIRALLNRGPTEAAAVYATGRTTGDLAAVPPQPLSVDLSEDAGRLDRSTDGDADADGFNERRGAAVVKVADGVRRLSLLVGPAGAAQAVSRPVLEFTGLPPDGTVTVLWEGKVVDTWQREPGRLVVEIPGELRGPQRLEVAVR